MSMKPMRCHVVVDTIPWCDSGLYSPALSDAACRENIELSCSFCNLEDAKRTAAFLVRQGYAASVVMSGCPAYGRYEDGQEYW